MNKTSLFFSSLSSISDKWEKCSLLHSRFFSKLSFDCLDKSFTLIHKKQYSSLNSLCVKFCRKFCIIIVFQLQVGALKTIELISLFLFSSFILAQSSSFTADFWYSFSIILIWLKIKDFIISLKYIIRYILNCYIFIQMF